MSALEWAIFAGTMVWAIIWGTWVGDDDSDPVGGGGGGSW